MRNLFKIKNQESQKGAAVVEFAIVAPILILLLAGVIELGLLVYNKQVITNAAREGARAAIRPQPLLNSSDISLIVTNFDVNLITSPNSGGSLNTQTSSSNGGFMDREFGDDVTVIVNYNYGFFLPGVIGLGPTIGLNSTIQMKMM